MYDGECPLCTNAAQALRIKQHYGELHLLDARTGTDPLLQKISDLGIDLDDGMVIYADGKFYHGKNALKFMAKYGDGSNGFTAICKGLFWSETVSNLTYPWMRGVRNSLLRNKRVPRIDNLDLKSEPTFKHIFGESWQHLPPVLKRHYANRPYTQDITIVEGKLDVMCRGPLKLLAPIMKLMGQIPAHNERNVPVTVEFQSDMDTKAFHFNRTFHFKNMSTYQFRSKMVQIRDNEVIEVMNFGLGWKMLYSWDGQKVVLKHKGYALSIFGHIIPIPLDLIFGKGYAEEIPVDDETFDMMTSITHPLWGKIYEYKGRFKITKDC